MDFKANWEEDKCWKILNCGTTCGLVGGDVLQFTSLEDEQGQITAVQIRCTREGIQNPWIWAEDCSYDPVEKRVIGTNDLLEAFSIHWTLPENASSPQLVCAYSVTEDSEGKTVLDWLWDCLTAFIEAVVALFTGEEPDGNQTDGGSGGGTWIAEEGSNGNLVAHLQMAV